MRNNEQPKAIYLKDYKEPNFWVENVYLLVQIFDGETHVTSTTTYKRNGSHTEPLRLNAEHMEIKSVHIDDQPTSFDYDESFVTIKTDADQFDVTILNVIKPEENTTLEGLYKSGDIYCTQCEAEGFRRITPYLDRPDVMTSFKARIEADKEAVPVLLCNGNLIEEGDLEKGRHYAVWEDPHKKPCYLFALVAGPLEDRHDTFTTASGEKVDLYIYTRPGDREQTAFAMDCLKKCMKWDEERFGREYDLNRFNVVAVDDFNFGAMENKSLNIFNTQLVLAHSDLATDSDHYRVDAVIAHEYFHNWSGNRVTCRDWFQLSLKEGFTVFREQEYCADMYSRSVQRIDDVAQLRAAQFPEDSGPMAHPIRPDNYMEINNFYTMTVYEKGSEVIRMIHSLIGEEKFRKASDLYFSRFDGQAVTCDDFVDCMEEASGKDLSQFRLWYSQAGTPEITVKGHYNADEKSYTFTMAQTVPDTPGQTNKKPMVFPIKTGLLGANGHDIVDEQTLELIEKEQSFTITGVSQEPVASVLRDFSSPVKLKMEQSKEQLRFRMVHDTDGFNKWEAGQTLALDMLMPMIGAAEKGEEIPTDPAFVEAVGDLIKLGGDKALLARALALPGESYIAQLRDKVDPIAIHTTRQRAGRDIGQALISQFEDLYNDNVTSGVYSPDHKSMAQRALKNTALAYICKADETKGAELAFQQFKDANNMTDRMAALANLVDLDTPYKQEALDIFYGRYKDYPLVVNKWFALQAYAKRDDTVDVVKTLMKHEDFNIKNPNRVRALIGAFAMGNPSAFHQHNGIGYQLLTDMIKQLDGINPMIAARLAAAFLQWKRFSPQYGQMMKAELETIASKEGLSPNVYEVVSKALKD